MTMYADDTGTSTSYSSTSLESINQTLNCELNLLKQWFIGNKFSLNVLKTQAVVIGSQPKINKITYKIVDHPQFLIGISQVENVELTRYLGLIVDRNFNWEEHIIVSLPRFLVQLGF